MIIVRNIKIQIRLINIIFCMKFKHKFVYSLNYQSNEKTLRNENMNKTKTQKGNSIGLPLNKISPNKLKVQTSAKSSILDANQQHYQPKPKQYCCLYHYLEGKQTKGITPCNNHVSLGVINPLTSLTRHETEIVQKFKNRPNKYQVKKNQQQLTVNADPYEFNFHTHFLNEIQNRGSKPKQLIKPRVYIEKILPKSFVKKDGGFLYPKSEMKAHFNEIYNFYKLFAEKTQFKTQKQLKDDIITFAKQTNIKKISSNPQMPLTNIEKTTISQYLFSRNDFVSYLVFHKLSRQSAQSFWQIIYNKDLFTVTDRSQSSLPVFKNDFISMKAFVYNFKKFYLQQEEYYQNTFSEPAFRQRLIDLRLILEPWFSRHILLKQKLRKWKKNELQTAQFLKTAGYEKEYEQMLKLIEDRNRIYFLMRTLAKSIYDLTDQKNFGIDVWNERITFLIEQKSDSLICFMQFIQKFRQIRIQQQISNFQGNNSQSFKITDLLEYLQKNNNLYQQLEEKWIVKWIRNIYKYLYHYKSHEQIYLDPVNYKLCLKSPIQIQNEMISEFVHYKSVETDNFLEVLRNVTEQIQEKLALMPELQGKKKYLVQCNYLVETLLRIVKRNNFICFQLLYEIDRIVIIHGFDFQNCYQQIVQVLRSLQEKSATYSLGDKLWKQIFMPENNSRTNIQASISFQSNEPYTYKDALDKYNNVKNALGIVNTKNNVNQFLITNSNKIKIQKPMDKKVKNLPKKAGEFFDKVKKEKEGQKQEVEQFDWGLKYKHHKHQNCSQGYCLNCQDVISTEVSSTIGRVEDMESYLMDLLRDV